LIHSEKYAEAAAEIEKEFQKSISEHSDRLEKISPDQRPVVTPDGGTLAWLDGKSLHYRKDGESHDFDLDFEGTGLFLSGGGKRALILNDMDERCRFEVIDLIENDSVEVFETTGCEGGSAVTDQGAVLFGKGGILHIYQSGSGDSEEAVEDRSRKILNLFSAKYKKLDNYHYARPLPSGEILIFYGGGGYYRLYLMNPDGAAASLIKEGFASPVLYRVLPENPLMTGVNGAHRSAQEPDLLAYSGTAGKYTMESIQIRGGVRLLATLQRPPVSDSLIFFSGNSTFLGVDPSERYYLYDALKYRMRYLPYTGKLLAVYDEGFILADEEFTLLLRATPFTEYEKKLMELYDRIAKEE
jgi:hypothetical protein